jgi:hypothetical protein
MVVDPGLLVAFDKHNSQLDRHRLLKFPPIPPYTTSDFSSEASADSRSVFLIDQDQRRSGTQREVRYEITPAELIAVIRARGTKLPTEHCTIDRNETPPSSTVQA